jgi:hypothetical protein
MEDSVMFILISPYGAMRGVEGIRAYGVEGSVTLSLGKWLRKNPRSRLRSRSA